MRARSAPLPRSISSIDTSDSENERKKWKRNIRREFESRFFAIVASLCLQNMNSYEVAKNIVLTVKEIYGSNQWHNFFNFFIFFLFTPDEQYTVELIQLTTTLVNKRGFI